MFVAELHKGEPRAAAERLGQTGAVRKVVKGESRQVTFEQHALVGIPQIQHERADERDALLRTWR